MMFASIVSRRGSRCAEVYATHFGLARAFTMASFVSAVVSYSLAYNSTDVMDNDNLATANESQIQISIVLIGTVRKPSVEPIV